MLRHNKINSRVSRFEPLETRNLLAGNVSAFVDSGGDLVIQGDAASNAIQLIQTAANTWKITGIATTVNGSHSFIATGVTRRIGTFMHQGNNTVQFLGGSALGVDFEGLNGNDTLLLSNLTVFDRVNIDAGNGTNSIVINNCSISDGLGITEGDNNDTVAITRTNISGGLLVELGNGTNALTMVNDNILQPSSVTSTVQPDQDELEIPDCGAVIVGGSGVDAIAMTGVKIDCYTQIDTLGGTDSVAIANSRFGNLVATSAPFIQPADVSDDPILVDPSLNDTFVGLYIQTGTGNDATTIANTTVYGSLLIDSSNHVNAQNASLDEFNLKDGNDSVVLNKVTVLDDGATTGLEVDTGILRIYTGSQNDAVVLNAVNTDADAWVFTTDFLFDNSPFDGADSVVITNSNFNRLDSTGTEFDPNNAPFAIVTGLFIRTGNGNDVVTIANVKVTEGTAIDTGNGTDHVAISALVETANPTVSDVIYADLGDGNYDTLSVVNSSAESAYFYGGGNTGDTLAKVHNHFGTEVDMGFDHVIE
jgi:hypothetical protein